MHYNGALMQVIQSVPLGTYGNNAMVQQHLSGFLQSYSKFRANVGDSEEGRLIFLSGNLDVSGDEVPIRIVIPHGFPNQCPMVFVEKTRGRIVASSNLNSAGKFFHPYLTQWNMYGSNLQDLCGVLRETFSKNFPIIRPNMSQSFSSSTSQYSTGYGPMSQSYGPMSQSYGPMSQSYGPMSQSYNSSSTNYPAYMSQSFQGTPSYNQQVSRNSQSYQNRYDQPPTYQQSSSYQNSNPQYSYSNSSQSYPYPQGTSSPNPYQSYSPQTPQRPQLNLMTTRIKNELTQFAIDQRKRLQEHARVDHLIHQAKIEQEKYASELAQDWDRTEKEISKFRKEIAEVEEYISIRGNEPNPEELIPTTPIEEEMMKLKAKADAISDELYVLDELLKYSHLSAQDWIAKVRKTSREQFKAKALMQKIQKIQSNQM